ncbi:hypothetical protein [Bacillus thermotolerans]|nr:hypothetical protein [Bacillus thermotolerans]
MAIRLVMFLTGFGLCVLGGVSCIMYLNLLETGFTMKEYIQFISNQTECYLFIAGLVMMTISIYFPTRQ